MLNIRIMPLNSRRDSVRQVNESESIRVKRTEHNETNRNKNNESKYIFITFWWFLFKTRNFFASLLFHFTFMGRVAYNLNQPKIDINSYKIVWCTVMNITFGASFIYTFME